MGRSHRALIIIPDAERTAGGELEVSTLKQPRRHARPRHFFSPLGLAEGLEGLDIALDVALDASLDETDGQERVGADGDGVAEGAEVHG